MIRLFLLFLVVWNVCLIRPADAKVVLTFEGEINLKDKSLRSSVHFPFLPLPAAVSAEASSSTTQPNLSEGQAIHLQVSESGVGSYKLKLNVDHVTVPMFDISSEVASDLKLENVNGQEFWAGGITSQYTLIDYQPIREMSGHYKIQDGKLVVDALKLGNVTYHGSVGLTSPYQVDLALELDTVDINDFLDVWAAQRKYDSSGNLSGTIKVAGTLKDLYLKGSLSSFGGFIKKLSYDSIYLNVEGIYPNVQVANSRVSEKTGMSFSVDGPINLNDRENFMKQIKALSLSPIISDSNTEREWTIRREEEGDGSRATEFKYLIRKDAMNPDNDESSGMLGVEKKMEF